MHQTLLLLFTLLAAQGRVRADLTSVWLQQAASATLDPPSPPAPCVCAPDPRIKDPTCTLCLCETEDISNVVERAFALRIPKAATCEHPGAEPTLITYSTGAATNCTCSSDYARAPQWTLCKCPAGATGPNPLGIPTTQVYTNWPTRKEQSPPRSDWARCSGRYALCSAANCTLDFPGADASSVPLAECGCVIPTPENELTRFSKVDPTYILDLDLHKQQKKECPQAAASPGCSAINSTPACKAIGNNTIYGGAYDYISTYSDSPESGGFSKLCVAQNGEAGLFAQCMTAACYERPAFDGSPISCYCPVYAAKTYLVGSPVNVSVSCTPDLPFVLSGVAVAL